MSGFGMTWDDHGLINRWRGAAKDSMNEALSDATLLAMVKAPRDTGFMANTITIEGTHEEGGKLVGRFGNWVAEYALWQEIGTSKMSAQPYLRPAADEVFPTLQARLKGRLS